MIHVCFGLHDKTGHYSKFTGTAMLSLFENLITPPQSTTVHILHDNTLTQDNREKFVYLAGQYNQLVKFYNVEVSCADKIAEFKKLLDSIAPTRTLADLYRFLIPNVIPNELKKIIYLDSDIIVNLDIQEFWQVNLGDSPLAVVPEMQSYVPTNPLHYLCRKGFVKAEDFFNSGVLMINLKKFRDEEENLKRGLRFRMDHPECDGTDQSVLNYCFSTESVKLPQKFNVLVEYARMNNDFETANRICHYITSSRGRGYGLNIRDPFNRLWMKYFVKTPWFDEETIGRLYNGVQQMHVSLKQSMVNLSAMMSGKTRAFFILPHDIDGLKKFFSIRDDEEIILAENQTSLQKLLDAMKKSQGKKVFFIMLPNFPFQALIQAGFVPNRDFVNGLEFLSEAQGLPLNSYQFINAM